MLFIPRQVLLELESVRQASVHVDPFFARDLFFRSVSALEDTDGKPPWAECVYLWVISCMPAILLCIGLAWSLLNSDWRALPVMTVVCALGYLLRLRLVQRLGLIVLSLLAVFLGALLTLAPVWASCLAGALFTFYFSYWYAAAVVRNLVMRSDRAYTLLFPGLRIEIRADSEPVVRSNVVPAQLKGNALQF